MATIVFLLFSILSILLIFYIWFMCWGVRADNIYEDEFIEKDKEIKWLKTQITKLLNSKNETENNFKILEQSYEKVMNENEWLVWLIEKYQDRYGPFKLSIADTYKSQIIEMYKEWKNSYKIAEEIWCSRSTIFRAIKKRWLER